MTILKTVQELLEQSLEFGQEGAVREALELVKQAQDPTDADQSSLTLAGFAVLCDCRKFGMHFGRADEALDALLEHTFTRGAMHVLGGHLPQYFMPKSIKYVSSGNGNIELDLGFLHNIYKLYCFRQGTEVKINALVDEVIHACLAHLDALPDAELNTLGGGVGSLGNDLDIMNEMLLRVEADRVAAGKRVFVLALHDLLKANLACIMFGAMPSNYSCLSLTQRSLKHKDDAPKSWFARLLFNLRNLG